MKHMDLRYDRFGKVVGLQWPDSPPAPEKSAKAPYQPPAGSRTGVGGREREHWCSKGLHDMSIHGRECKTGGRECHPCKLETRRKRVAKMKERKASEATVKPLV